MLLYMRWQQKLSVMVQVLDANVLAMCMPFGDTYHTRPATSNASASVHRAVAARLSQMGSDPHCQ
jgi:hypothetical protein